MKEWIPFRHRVPARVRARLFCLPFAGAGAVIYRSWSERLFADGVDVCAVELPGRGTRFDEPPISDPTTLITMLEASLSPLCHGAEENVPIVWFGHSLGARLGFSLAQKLRANAFVASGARAPSLPTPTRRSELPRDQFIASLKALGGTPPEILSDAEFLEMLIPPLRADLRVVENLTSNPTDTLACPLTVLAAADDQEVPIAEAEVWKKHTTGEFQFVKRTNGGHFFVVNDSSWVLDKLRVALSKSWNAY